jgi:N-methylhydantoinase A
VPGPACYGRGGREPTVTDADLVLGLIDADAFLGGKMKLDRAAAEAALVAGVGARHGLSALDAAAAVHEMVNESMAMAARIHAVEHGEDPRAFTLVAFGGAGPVHAWRIASILRMAKVVVPVGAGVMSAIGLLVATPAIELSASHTGKLDAIDLAAIDRLLAAREAEARAILARTGVAAAAITVSRTAECRYVGQAYEVQAPLPEGSLAQAGPASLIESFERRYRQLYGRTLPGGTVEALTWRVRAEGPATGALPRLAPHARAHAVRGTRRAWFHGHGVIEATVLDRYALAAGARHAGPALIEEDETTTVAGPGSTVEVDRALNLVITLGA